MKRDEFSSNETPSNDSPRNETLSNEPPSTSSNKVIVIVENTNEEKDEDKNV